MRSNAPNASGDSGTSTPPAIAASISPTRIALAASPIATAPLAQELAVDRIGPADVERDAEVRRRRPAEHREGEGGGHGAQAALEVLLVLRLCERDPTEGRPEVDPDPLAVGRARDARDEAGVGHRHPPRREPELAEPVHRAGRPGVHEVERLEVVDLGRDLRPERRRVEAVDALDRARRRAKAARNAGSPIPTAEMTPMPVMTARRRTGDGGVAMSGVRRGSGRTPRAPPRAHGRWRACVPRSGA